MDIRRVWVLSTGHMPNTSPEWGDLPVAEYKEGAIVPFLPSRDTLAEYPYILPEWFKPIYERAMRRKVSAIIFDADEDEDEDIPWFDW